MSELNLTKAKDSEISQNLTEAEAILKKELVDEWQKRLAAEDQVTKLQKELEAVQQKLKVSEDETEKLKKELGENKKTDLTMDSLKDNPQMVLFHTGLHSFAALRMVFDLALKTLPSVRIHGKRKLSNFAEFLITLIKPRLYLRN